MKKTIISVLIVLILFSFCGCNSSYVTYYNEISDYQNIWKLSGFHHSYGYGNISDYFPKDLESLNVVDFFCRYDEYLPLGEGVQLLLTVKYDDEAFTAEKSRLTNLSFAADDYFEPSKNIKLAKRFDDEDNWEYSFIDDDEQTVTYIILHNVFKESLEIPKEYVPKNYNPYTWTLQKSGENGNPLSVV